MGNLSDFQRGQIVGVRLAGASVTKLATVRCVQSSSVHGYDGMGRLHQLRGIATENQI